MSTLSQCILKICILILCIAVSANASEVKVTHLCPRFILIGDLDPGLTDVEKRLVCGDPEGNPKHPNDAWATIPYPQAKYNLTNFLQQRGYHHLRFFPKDSENSLVEVELGAWTPVTHVSVEGVGDSIEISRMRKVIGAPLTPEILDRVEKWVTERLGELGHACPIVKSQANSETGEVIVRADPGPLQKIYGVTEEPIPGTHEGVLSRYSAFLMEQQFNSNLLTVTENRVTTSRVVQSTSISSRCEGDRVYLHHNVLPGPPRLLTVGFGVNTEGLFLGRASWRNTRLGNFGSLLDVSLYGSVLRQSLISSMNWYFLPYVSRYYLNPLANLIHRNEQHFEDISATAQVGLATTFELTTLGMSIFLGPTLEVYRTLRGTGAPTSKLLSLENRLNFQSHGFERYLSSPRTGYRFSLVTDLNEQSLYSDVTAQRLNFRGEVLWNLKNYDPPLWIFGARAGYFTILTNAIQSQLPASLLQYLGGSANLRGFGRFELPRGGQGGGLTSGFFGLEARLSHTLPYDVDPFVFVDVGGIGFQSVSFDSPVYWSPGVGLRWASPIGPIRTTIAHGYSDNTPDHIQFYFSLGEEF